MKIIVLLISIFISSALLSSEVKVTAHPDYPPVAWESGGTLKGASVKLVEQALANIGYKAVFIPVGSWGRAQAEVKAGRIDILLPPYKTSKREKFYKFPKEPFLMDRTVLIAKKGRVINFEKLEDLKKYSGVAITNDSFGDEFDKIERMDSFLRRLSSTKQCLDFILRGRADYLIAGENAVLSLIQKLNLAEKFDIQEQIIIETGMYTAISKKSIYNTEQFSTAFFNEIKRLVDEGAHQQAMNTSLKEYSGEDEQNILR